MRLAAVALAVVAAAGTADATDPPELAPSLDRLKSATRRGDLALINEALIPLCGAGKRVWQWGFHPEAAGSRRFTEVVARAARTFARAGHHKRAFRAQLCALNGFRPTDTNCHRPAIRGPLRASIAETGALLDRWLTADRADHAGLRRLLGHRAGVVRHFAARRNDLADERRCARQTLKAKFLRRCSTGRSDYSRMYVAVGGCVGEGAGRMSGASISGSRLPLGIEEADITAKTAAALARIAATHTKRWDEPAPLEVTARWLRGLEALAAGDAGRAETLMSSADVKAHRATGWLSQLLLIRSRRWRDRGEHSRALADTTNARSRERWVSKLRAIEHAANLRAAGRYAESAALLERQRGNRRFGCGISKGPARADPAEAARHRGNIAVARAVAPIANAASRCLGANLGPLQRLVARDQPAVAKELRVIAGTMRRRPSPAVCDRLLGVLGKIDGLGDTAVAALYNDLGASAYGQGRFADARRLFSTASCTGSPSQRLRALSNQAGAAFSAGDPVGAARSLERARLHEYAATPRTLVALELNAGMVELGRDFFADALVHFEKARAHLGAITDVRLRAQVLDRIGLAHDLEGRRDQAARHYRQALALREKLGADHPELANSLSNLATISWARGELAKTRTTFARMLRLEERFLLRLLAHGSEGDKRQAVAKLDGTVDWLVSLDLHADKSTKATELAFTAIVGRQGRALDAAARDHATLLEQAPPALRVDLEELRSVGERIVSLTLSGDRAAELRRLEGRARRIETQLGDQLSSIDRGARQTASEIRAAINRRVRPGQALITYVNYRRFNPREGVERFSAPRYAAYVITAGGRIGGVDLGEAKVIDRKVRGWRAALGDRDDDQAALAAKLGAALFEPLLPLLGGARDLYLAPDSMLNLIPFDALIARGQVLHQRYRLTYLTSPRDLAAPVATAGNAGDILIFANPDFGPVERAASRGGLLGDMPFAPLPGTAVEAAGIVEVLDGAHLKSGRKATGASFKAVSRPAILHVATHGFFLPAEGQATGEAGLISDALPPPDRSAAPALLRSGLAFTGINRSTRNTVVTGLELARLDLTGTRLVTLSACDTGGGEAVSGDGVYGMRRALYLAGAQSQIISLWQVDDAATAALMVQLYRELSAGQSRAAALRRAKAALQREPKHHHPYYWAAFILAGDPGKLDGSPAGPVTDLSRRAPPPPDQPIVRPTRPVRGQRGCGCDSGGASGHGWPWLLVGIGILFARKRHREISAAQTSS